MEPVKRLKIRVTDIKFDESAKWRMSLFKRALHVTIDLIDSSGSLMGPTFNTRPSADPMPNFQQTSIFPVQLSTVNGSHARVKLFEENRCVGQCPLIEISQIPMDKVVDQYYPIEGGRPLSLHLIFEWMQLPTRSVPRIQKSNTITKDIHLGVSGNGGGGDSSNLVRNRTIQHTLSQVSEINTKLIRVLQDLEKQKVLNKKISEVLKRFRDIDEDARKLLGATIDWEKVRNTAKQLESTSETPLPIKGGNPQDESAEEVSSLFLDMEMLSSLSHIHEKIRKSDATWLKKFLAANGLENIFHMLKKVEEQEMSQQLSLQAVQLGGCIKTILNTQSSCEFSIRFHQKTLVDIILFVITSKNTLLKSQLFTVFAALCIYGSAAHEILVNAVESNEQQYHTLVKIMTEEQDKELIASCMSFINGLVLGEKELESRMKLRMSFTNADIHSAISLLTQKFTDDEVILLQFQVFEQMGKKDELELKELRFVGNIDLLNPRSVFNQVVVNADALGVESVFLHHLQHLLLIPHLSDDPSMSWRFVEHGSRRAISRNINEKVPTTTTYQLNTQIYKVFAFEKALLRNEKKSESCDFLRRNTSWKHAAVGEKDEDVNNMKTDIKNLKPHMGYIFQLEYGTVDIFSEDGMFLQHQPPPEQGKPDKPPLESDVPPPETETKVKPFYWNAVTPTNKPLSGDLDPSTSLDELSSMFQELQDLFNASKEKKKKMSLLSLRTANNVGILRVQFRHLKNEQIIEKLFNVNDSGFETHHFEALLGCIPPPEEMERLLSYKGNLSDLVPVDQFALTLVSVPQITEKLKAFIYWDNFEIRVSMIDNALTTMKQACDELSSSPMLKKILGIVLSMGNFLNCGTKLGNTQVFGSKSLLKLSEVRSAEDKNVTLMHYLSSFIDTNFKDLVSFSKELVSLEAAMRYEPEMVLDEMEALERGLQEIIQQVEQQQQEAKSQYHQFFEAMTNFSQFARLELDRILIQCAAFSSSSDDIINAFGGNEKNLAVKDIWGHFHTFAKKFTEALEEQQRQREEAERIKKTHEFWVQESMNRNKIEVVIEMEDDNEQIAPTESFGIMEKLILLVKQGNFKI